MCSGTLVVRQLHTEHRNVVHNMYPVDVDTWNTITRKDFIDEMKIRIWQVSSRTTNHHINRNIFFIISNRFIGSDFVSAKKRTIAMSTSEYLNRFRPGLDKIWITSHGVER